jgi:hypothetical protein
VLGSAELLGGEMEVITGEKFPERIDDALIPKQHARGRKLLLEGLWACGRRELAHPNLLTGVTKGANDDVGGLAPLDRVENHF